MKSPPLLAEIITDDLSASSSTRLALAHRSERQLQEALAGDSVQTADVLPYEEKLFIPPMPLFFPVIRDIESWAPQKFSSRVHILPAKISYEAGTYTIQPKIGAEFRIGGPLPSGDLRRARGVAISLRRAALPSSLAIYYPIRPPLSDLIPQQFVLEQAMYRLLQRGPVKGVDGISVEKIKDRAAFIKDVQQRFLENRVNSKPLRQKLIPKKDGRFRELSIPCARDHLIQAAIFEVMSPYTETYFLPSSFGFRTGRSAIDAIRQFRSYLDEGFRWVVMIDIKDFFDSISFPVLRKVLKQDLEGDWRLVVWIMSQAKAKLVMENGDLVRRQKGVPQGGPLSPLLGNMVLHRLDVWAKNKGFRMMRFADDITFVARKKHGAEKILMQAKEFLETTLDLTVNSDKSGIYDTHTEPITLLGFDIEKGIVKPSRENIEMCKESLRELLTSRYTLEEKFELFYRSARSWGEYFRKSFDSEASGELETWMKTINVKNYRAKDIDTCDNIRLRVGGVDKRSPAR